MGKKRITTGTDQGADRAETKGAVSSKRKLVQGILAIHATYNNTKISLTDTAGNTVAWSSSGSLGFKGAKKGTPFAAGKVAELLADKAQAMGLKEVDILVKGVGAGRESAIRAFAARGFTVGTIKDGAPEQHNRPTPPK